MGQKNIKMITIQVSNDAGLKAIKALEQKKKITIINEIDLTRRSLPGSAMSEQAFKDWIAKAEKSPTVSLEEAEKLWAEEMKQIRKLIR
jgi:hypothetical protein